MRWACDNHRVRVECRRMGGGFGGKETQSGHLAVWPRCRAQVASRPVKLRLDRDDDFMITGKRHPFAYDYTVGFDDDRPAHRPAAHHAGQLRLQADLSGPVADRAVFHFDNAYWLPTWTSPLPLQDQHPEPHRVPRLRRAAGRDRHRDILGDIARHLGLDPLDVRRATCTASPSAT
jgi:xanthine dehydrogenase large subunit